MNSLALGNKVVTSQHYLSSLVGLKILEKGGNAFDAILAMSATLSVVLPHTGGIGGDGFLLALRGDEIIAYNGSGKSPKNFDSESFIRETPIRGPLTVTIPGLVDLWNWAGQYCNLSLKEILSPAIKLAEEGFFVNKELETAITNSRIKDEDWLSIYGNKKLGDELIQKDLAECLKIIARNPEDFYRGDLARDIVDGLSKKGVKVEISDFEEHRGELMKPIRIDFLGHEIYELPPNSQGITTLEILKMVEMEELYKLPFDDQGRIKEHLKIAYTAYLDRDMYIADPSFMKINPEFLLSESHLEKKKHEKQRIKLESKDTTFLAAADDKGNMVGLIQSLFHPFGSGITFKGIVFQNRAIGFSRKKNLPNSPAGGKRPLHTLSIALLEGKGRKILIGCAGGDLRPQIHAEVIENIVCYGMDLQRAVDAPRFMLTSWEGEAKVISEKRLNLKFSDQFDYYSRAVGIVNAIELEGNVYKGVADPRSEGLSLALGKAMLF